MRGKKMMDDSISRQTAISVIAKWMLEYGGEGEERERNALKQAAEEIKELPSAEPERKKGKWVAIGNTGLAACKCGFFTDRYRAYNFCPNCGDEMEKGEDDG